MSRLQPVVNLFWLPLGAGGRSVRLNGRVFEAAVASLERRPPCDLYHSALEAAVPEGRFVIEMAPIPRGDRAERGVVAEGPVGSRWARSLRLFRYEIRRWRDGVIPDVAEAVDSPQRLTDQAVIVQRVLDLVPAVPTPVWGRDELDAGEMWNSNSLISWLLVRSGVGLESARLTAGGRAPGWDAGIEVARREEASHGRTSAAGRSSASLRPHDRAPAPAGCVHRRREAVLPPVRQCVRRCAWRAPRGGADPSSAGGRR